jgi:hypothetical protein
MVLSSSYKVGLKHKGRQFQKNDVCYQIFRQILLGISDDLYHFVTFTTSNASAYLAST